MITLTHYMVLSAALFCLGILGILIRRNAIAVLMSVELILNAANINLVATQKYLGTPDGLGQVFSLFVIAIAAAASVVGLVLIISIYRHDKSVFVDQYKLMKD
jgi:NADH:ubiquinone oxidoreductase subunit K